MSQPTPGRPLPPYVYRRRRLAVFGGLGLVILLILLITHPWSGGAQAGKSDQVVIPATSTPSSNAQAGSAPTGLNACDPDQVKVTAYTDAESYAAGQFPQVSVGVENIGNSACTLNVGTSQQQFTISSAAEPVWVSTDCQKESSDYDLTLQPGQPVKSEPIQWDRTRSNPGTCTLPQRDPVPAGGASYSLTATVDGVTSSNSTQFSLN